MVTVAANGKRYEFPNYRKGACIFLCVRPGVDYHMDSVDWFRCHVPRSWSVLCGTRLNFFAELDHLSLDVLAGDASLAGLPT